jgi:CRP-like cAMP-binding protein
VIADGTADEMLDGHAVATLEPGDDFGGTGLLARTTHPSTIRARTPMVLGVMSTQEFLTAYSTVPALHDHVDDEPARIARRWNVPTAPVPSPLHADPSVDYTFAS